MSPQLYYAVMLLTNPQKARRILLAEELENWFMDLFDEEYEDVLQGKFLENQSTYIDKIIDKYLETTKVSLTNADEYSQSVIDKAVLTATQIQEVTVRHILMPHGGKSEGKAPVLGYGISQSEDSDSSSEIRNLILAGIAFSGLAYGMDKVKKWFDSERANTIALNEANWIYTNEEYFEAKETKTTKTWHTSLDEKVRFTHMEVEGVTIPIDEAFEVGASKMMYPMDYSLGADASEIVNCRCSVSYE